MFKLINTVLFAICFLVATLLLLATPAQGIVTVSAMIVSMLGVSVLACIL
jgi:hypothetical protein